MHGISFLEYDHWLSNYDLSLEILTAAAEAALVLKNVAAVKLYSNEVVLHARCFDDKLNCKYTPPSRLLVL